LRDIIFLFFVVFLLFAALNPLANYFEERIIPRVITVLFFYIVILFGLGFAIYLLVPPIVHQLQSLSDYVPQYLGYFKMVVNKTQNSNFLNQGLQNSLQTVANSLSTVGQSAWSGVVSVFGGIVSFVVIIVASFYLLLYKKHFNETVLRLVPEGKREFFKRVARRSLEKLGAWTRAELVLMLIMGVLIFIVLTVLNVKFALLLAILAGVLELVPSLGPILAAIPAVAIAFVASPLQALLVVIAYILIQQLESQFLVPYIMRRTIDLNPVMTIFALLVGAQLAGILGAIIAVPMLAVFLVVFEEIANNYENASAQS
jgi:predicted PurR-regulated permease PerM